MSKMNSYIRTSMFIYIHTYSYRYGLYTHLHTHIRSICMYTLKTTDFLQIKSGWDGPYVNNTPLPGMLVPINFLIEETINTFYYTKHQSDQSTRTCFTVVISFS